jgi:hypothetical protein
MRESNGVHVTGAGTNAHTTHSLARTQHTHSRAHNTHTHTQIAYLCTCISLHMHIFEHAYLCTCISFVIAHAYLLSLHMHIFCLIHKLTHSHKSLSDVHAYVDDVELP